MTRTRYGVSPWIDEFRRRRPDHPRYRGDASVPVAVIGGGLTGVLTAHGLSAAGVKVVLLEAERLGEAGAGRGPGVLQGEAAPAYREVEARLGRKAARAVFSASRRAVLDFAAAARRLGVTTIDTHEALRIVSPFGGDERTLAREVALRRDVGLDATWLKPAAVRRDVPLESPAGGVRLGGWGQVQPYEVLVAVAAAAGARGAQLFERSPVRRVKTGRRSVLLELEGGTLEAATVIVCTGGPTALYKPLQRHLRVEERYLALTERPPAAVRKAVTGRTRVLTDTDAPPHIIRWLSDGRLLVAGAEGPPVAERRREQVVIQRTGQLMYELSRLLPAISGLAPAYGWHLPLALAHDGVLVAGPHRNYPRHLFAWGTRHDPAQAFLASRILLRHVAGDPDPVDRYFAFTRG